MADELKAFKREDRYIVIKRKDLAALADKGELRPASLDGLVDLCADLPAREYVVIESDWPEYQVAWQMIEARVNGSAQLPSQGGEAVEVVAWQDAENPLYTTAERRVMHDWAGNGYPIVELMTVAQHERIMAAQQRTQTAPVVPKGKVLIDVAVVEFLNGSGELHGMYFGDRIPGQPQFWWRHYLPTSPAQPAVQGVLCHGCFSQGVAPDHFDAAGKCKAMQPAAQDQSEVQRLRAERDGFRESLNNLIEAVSVYLNEIADLREALARIAGEDYEAPHDADNDYISRRKSACITRMRDVARDALAASTGQEVNRDNQ